MSPSVHKRSASHQPLEDRPDRDLVYAIARGEERALEELMERKTSGLLALAYRFVGDREEAKDLVQHTFLRVWQKGHRYNSRYSVNTWLYRITTNLAIDALRSRQVRARYSEPVRHHLLRLVGGRQGPDMEQLIGREVVRILRDLASGLSRRQRQAFVLREVEGLSSRQVAEVLGCRESTVRNHLFTARRFLRQEVLRRFPEYADSVTRANRGEE